jgi:hypothetical protein
VYCPISRNELGRRDLVETLAPEASLEVGWFPIDAFVLWTADRHGLEQAKAEADWLRKWVQQRTGIEAGVKPILMLPGWWEEMKARGEVMVVNSKYVASAVEGRSPVVLNGEQIDLIACQLDLVCRDVEA